MGEPVLLAVERLDEVIIGLMAERERLIALSIPSDATVMNTPGIKSAFQVPIMRDTAEEVAAFSPLLPGLWVGFEPDSDTRIFVNQPAKANSLISPPDHHYVFELRIEEPGTSKWITLEATIGRMPHISDNVVTVAFKGSASSAAELRFEISVPQSLKPDMRVSLGMAKIEPGYSFGTISSRLEASVLENSDPEQSASILAFLPLQKGFAMELAYLSVFASRERI